MNDVRRGDYIEAILPDCIIRGVALTDFQIEGWGSNAIYSIGIERGSGPMVEIELNANYAKPKLLFSAEVARDLSSDKTGDF